MMSSAVVRPRMRWPSVATTWPESTIGFHGQAVIGAAIEFGDDRVLGDVDQTTGQVARVRRLQRRVRETLAGAVGRVEVLETVQAFLEVRP